ncbi:MAG: oligopeptide transport system substrate-binding protein [Thermomicrobiales bacterium]|nr:oligopeptide transport system substrate-binding protein [Thermomicrobiales bacterium]
MANRDHSAPSAQIGELMRAAATRSVSRRDLLKRAAALGAGASVLAGLNAVGVSAAPSMNRLRLMNAALQGEELAEEQVVRLPEGEPVRFDPGVSSGGKGLEMLQNLFEGLVYIDQRDGSLQMGLAEKMEPNADATEFTFTLRDGLKWSDGTPLNATDFEYSWKRVLDPNTKSEYTSAMYPVKNGQAIDKGEMTFDQLAVTAADEKTLKVTLEGPTPYFPLLAATWTFYPVPKHVIEKEGDAWVEAGKMVSNGPYMLTAWEHNQSMVLDQNPNYYGEKPTITKANYTLFDDNVAQALVPFENDELDQAQVSAADLDRVKNDETLSKLMQVFPRSGTRFVACDCTNPPTDDPRVRQALSLAINRDTLANGVLKGQFTATQTILPPDIPGHNPEATLGENVDQAKQLLADAGFPDGKDFPELKLVYISTATDEKQTAEYLQGVWKQNLGISVTLDPLEDKAHQDWFNSLKTQPYNLGIDLWGSDWGDPANWHNQLFESAADFYHNHWKNDQFDQIVRAAAVNPDAEARIAQYKDAEKILVQDAPNIPLYNLNRIYVIKPNVRGIYHYPILGRTWIRYISIVKE